MRRAAATPRGIAPHHPVPHPPTSISPNAAASHPTRRRAPRGTLGPAGVFGLGGISVELFRDVAWLALPTDDASIRNAIASLKLGAVLKGFRGKPPADINALVKAIIAFGEQFVATMPALLEFEINPLLVLPQGRGVIALDALVSSMAKTA